jgi:hypothetical protein
VLRTICREADYYNVGTCLLNLSSQEKVSDDVCSVWRDGNMARKIFCDKCGRELKASEAIQLLEYDLCIECCKKTLGNE